MSALAEILRSISWEPYWVHGPKDPDGSYEMVFDFDAFAARLEAAGVTVQDEPDARRRLRLECSNCRADWTDGHKCQRSDKWATPSDRLPCSGCGESWVDCDGWRDGVFPCCGWCNHNTSPTLPSADPNLLSRG